MVCVVLVWAAGLYYLFRWFLYALQPLDYPAAPRWLCDSRKAWGRRALIVLIACTAVAWSYPMAVLVLTAMSSAPWLVYGVVNFTLIGWGIFRFLDPPKLADERRQGTWLPVSGRWIPGLLIAVGLLGLAWQLVTPPR